MNVARRIKPWLVPLAVLLAGVIFSADVSLPLGVASGVPYVLVVFLGWCSPGRGAIFALAALASVLTAAGYVFSPQGGTPWMVLTNRGLTLLAIWGTAIPLALAKKTLEALRKSQESLANAQKIANMGNWDWNIGTGELWWSDEIYRIFGQEPQAFGATYDAFLDTIHPEDRPRVEDAVGRALEGEPYGIDHRIVLPDGSGRIVHEQGEVDFDNAGKPLRMSGTVQDISDRKRAEEALRKAHDELESRIFERTRELTDTITELRQTEAALRDSEERFRAGFEHAAAGLAMVNADGRFQMVNPAFCEFLGYSEQECLALDRVVITHPDDRQESARDLHRLWAGDIDSARFEKRYLHKDGHVVWGDAAISLVRDADGAPLYSFGQVQDITDRKHAEEALRDSEDQMRVITDSVPALIGYIDSTQRYRFVNKHYEDLYGAKREDIVGKHVSEVIGEKLYHFTLPQRTAALRGEEAACENEIVDAQGSLRYQQATYVPHIDDSGGVIGYFTLVHDITEHKQAEKERRRSQRLKALGNMAGGIAHNLNNLLVPIQALSEMALEEFPEESPSREDMRRVVRSSQSAKELVSRILQFGRKDSLVRQNIDVCAAVAGALELLPTIVPPTVKPRVDLDPDTGMVFADADQIQTVVMNLIFNAVDAMEGRTGKIEISLSAVDVGDADDETGAQLTAGRYARLSVADSGRGMDAETLEHVFEPFFTTKDIGEGTGLGLSSAYRIVTQHGGSIHAASTPGEGSRFCVYLPLSERQLLH